MFCFGLKLYDLPGSAPGIASPNFMALMLREARMASLSAKVGSSLLGTLAERITHMSHRFTLTERRSALLRGEPSKMEIWGKYIKIDVGEYFG